MALAHKDMNKASALHTACERRDVSIEMLELLLDRGLDPNAKYRRYFPSPLCTGTPLDLIFEKSQPNIAIVQLLLTKGSDFDLGMLSRIRHPILRQIFLRTCKHNGYHSVTGAGSLLSDG